MIALFALFYRQKGIRAGRNCANAWKEITQQHHRRRFSDHKLLIGCVPFHWLRLLGKFRSTATRRLGEVETRQPISRAERRSVSWTQLPLRRGETGFGPHAWTYSSSVITSEPSTPTLLLDPSCSLAESLTVLFPTFPFLVPVVSLSTQASPSLSAASTLHGTRA